ncbi:hypothetical protein [Methylorubrum thiocyanatum]|uniref:Uncharacterized protein n=1 Tax=Methylorubrum thiocyanatum TaxID=47958 RepID=A0AA40RZZ9_9HYPH|nr:hypothetical protein [Methylorubrum thiocyanatum]MBA8912070.1 hypothetical protein [Methylorubrum thiocyanatum]GJE79637.1 hypothetical protein CJNNKLLH_0963 [Methylorubrum thiocyanatum]
MSVTDWSPQPSGNAAADRTIPARDGMAGREFPEAIRGLMAKAAALALDQGGALISGGVGNFYTVATNSSFGEMKPGVAVSFTANRTNTAGPVLSVDGSEPRQWIDADGAVFAAGDVKPGQIYSVAWIASGPGGLPAWKTFGTAPASVGKAVAAAVQRGHTVVLDKNYQVLPTDVQVGMAVLTAPRVVSLADVDTFPLGQDLVIADESGACSETLTITIQPGPGTGDIIGGPEGATTIVLSSAYQAVRFRRGAANLWIRL